MKKIALFLMTIVVLFTACNGEGGPTSIESMTLNPNNFQLKIGAEKRIKVSIMPVTDEVYTLNWESSDEAIATVDTKGNVVGVAAGDATITATIDGTNISATASVSVVSPFDALNFYTLALMGMNEDAYQIEGMDNNCDDVADTIYEVMFYVLPETMYLQEKSLVGENDYMLVLNTAMAVCYDAELGGKVAYSLGAYRLFDNEEDYLVEVNGKKRIKPHAGTITHFNQDIYLNAYQLNMSEGQDAANAYIDENGYWLGDYDSQLSYVNFELPVIVDAGVIVAAELECGSKGNYDLDYYNFQLKMFEKPYAYGFKTQMGENPETGEVEEQFVWPLEMADMVERTYTYGKPSQPTEEVQARVSKQTVPFESVKKQIAVNRALFTSLNFAFKK